MVKVLDRETIIRWGRGSNGGGVSVSGGDEIGITLNDVWGALALNTDEQINLSHLTSVQTWADDRYLKLTGGTINGNLNVTGTLSVASKLVATQEWVGQNYISIAFFERLFKAYNGNTQVNANDTTSTIDNIKAMFGFWTEQYLSALGQNSGGGGLSLNQPLSGINSAGLGVPTSSNVAIVWDGSAWGYAPVGGGSGTVTQVNVGSSVYTPVNGVVSLPAYPTVPTNVSAFTNDAGYITSAALNGYLPLSGGVINANNQKAPLILKGGLGNFREGLRIIPYGEWSDILLAGSDATETSETSANSWFIGNHGGDFYITRNGSDSSSSAILSCVNNAWSINGNSLIHSGNIGSQSVSYATSAGSATQLSTARTIWGQSFNGTGNVEGTVYLNRVSSSDWGRISFYSSSYYTWYFYMTNASDISPTGASAPSGSYVSSWALRSLIENLSGYGWTWESCSNASGENPSIKMELSSNTGNLYVSGDICNGGSIGVGTTSPSYKLHVSGTLYASGNTSIGGTFGVTGTTILTGVLTANGGIVVPSNKTVKIGNAYLSYDSTNNAIRVSANADGTGAANFYSMGGVTALGAGSDSGGGGVSLNQPLSGINTAGLGAPSSSNIAIVWNGSAWTYTPISSGSVTSVKVGTTTYNPVSGVVSLPAYPTVPTAVSQLTNDSGYITNSALSGYATTSQLSNYLPLSGGKVTGTLIVQTNGTGIYNQGIRVNRASADEWSLIMIGTQPNSTEGTGTSSRTAWLVGTPNSSNSLIFCPNAASESVGLCLKGSGTNDAKWNDNTIYHTGNLPAYPTKASWNYDDVYVKYAAASSTTVDDSNNNPYFFNLEANELISGYGRYWYIINLGHYSLNNYAAQISFPYDGLNSDSELFIRCWKSSWLSWRRVLHSNNYTDYTVTKTGTGASGSWAINASTATALQTSRTIWGQSFNGTSNVEGTLHLNRSASGDYGRISFYSSSYYTWYFYMTNASDISPTGASAPSGSYVSRWALRSLIENLSGYGWTWESSGNAANATPSIMMELSSATGDLRIAGIFHAQNIKIENTNEINSINTSLNLNHSVSGNVGLGYGGGETIVYGTRLQIQKSSEPYIYFHIPNVTHGNIRLKSNSQFYFYGGNENTQAYATGVVAGAFYSYGQVTALSDERDKNVIGNVGLSVEQIADAPAIRFLWKDGRADTSMQTGSIAQYWQKVLPEVIREKEDRLSLSYGVAGLVSAIVTARRVVDHEKRIAELERENQRLKKMLNVA